MTPDERKVLDVLHKAIATATIIANESKSSQEQVFDALRSMDRSTLLRALGMEVTVSEDGYIDATTHANGNLIRNGEEHDA